MEGNACYKFHTIQRFLAQTGQEPVRLALDIGANVGTISQLMAAYFPEAVIHAYEAVEHYYWQAHDACLGHPRIRVHHQAVTAQHLFRDDLGTERAPAPLQLHIATAQAGAGWPGGSWLSRDATVDPLKYRHATPPSLITFEQVLSEVLTAEGRTELDLVKFDCEGCEHSCLGCTPSELLGKIRFIVGEYHNLSRFYRIMEEKLFRTHNVSLVGWQDLGAFFAERHTEGPSILKKDRDDMLSLRPWLAPFPITWNVFEPQWIPPGEEPAHGYPKPASAPASVEPN